MSKSETVATVKEKKTPIKLGVTEAALKKLEAKYKDVPDAKTPEGYQAIKDAKKELVPLRTGVEKERKLQVAAAVEHQRRVNKLANSIKERIEAIEKPLYDAKQKVDDEEAEKKRQEELREQNRVADIKDLINDIEVLTEGLLGAGVDEIQERLEAANAIVITDSEYMEFVEQASEALTRVKDQLGAAVNSAKALAEQQAELDRKQKILDDAAEEQRKADAERQRKMDEQQAAMDARQKELDDAAAAEEQRKRDEEQRIADAEKAKKEAAELAARLPEDIQLREFANSLISVPMPEVEDEHSIKIMNEVMARLEGINAYVYENTQSQVDEDGEPLEMAAG